MLTVNSKRSTVNGFTYIEVILALVILAVALVPMLIQFPIGAKGNVVAKDVTIATNLAMELMEEIKGKAYEDPDELEGSFGTEEGTRNLYDDVDDYDDWSVSPPQDIDGNPMDGTSEMPDFSNFTREVVVVNVNEDDLNTVETDGSTDFKRITVTVSKDNNVLAELVTVVSKY